MQKLFMLTLAASAWLGALALPAVVPPTALAVSNDLEGYLISDTTLIILDGNVVKLESLPPYTEMVSFDVDPTSRTVIRLVLRSRP